MPTYDYECDACGHAFELFQRIVEDPISKCPECRKMKLRRLFGTGAAVVFKGSGFYQTDYRSESYKKAAKDADSASGDTKDTKKSEKGSQSKSDSAPSPSSESSTSKSSTKPNKDSD